MRIRRKINPQETEVDMTPMLDIVFIMLIFFIVTTSFVKESGIVVNRPPSEQNHDPQPIITPILIEIDANNDIRIGGRFIDLDSIQANVETARSRNPKAPVVVKVHEAATSGIVVRAVDQSKLAGAGQVTVIKTTG